MKPIIAILLMSTARAGLEVIKTGLELLKTELNKKGDNDADTKGINDGTGEC